MIGVESSPLLPEMEGVPPPDCRPGVTTSPVAVAYMMRERIDYLHSFDDDFDGLEGVTRLSTADDPFG